MYFLRWSIPNFDVTISIDCIEIRNEYFFHKKLYSLYWIESLNDAIMYHDLWLHFIAQIALNIKILAYMHHFSYLCALNFLSICEFMTDWLICKNKLFSFYDNNKRIFCGAQ